MPIFDFKNRNTEITPTIYAYSDKKYPGLLKIGYTDRSVELRVKEQQGVLRPGENTIKIEYQTSAMRADGSIFSDHQVHRALEELKKENCNGEWYRCKVEDVEKAVFAVRNNTCLTNRIYDFKLRPEQEEAINSAMNYFINAKNNQHIQAPKFLWNCKMRFGKTFASYELAKRMNLKRVLVITFKPAVKSAWKEDLNTHVDFEGWQFLAQPSQSDSLKDDLDIQYQKADKLKPIVCFGSLQDLLGVDKNTGRIKVHNKWIHATNWDLVIFDEYHFGAWKEKTQDLFKIDDDEKELQNLEKEDDYFKSDVDSEIDETFLPITSKYYLYLSGTPFRAINSGEFIEEQIYSWTYSDEQKAKENWDPQNGKNPYESLPRMVMLTYKIPEAIRSIAINTEFNEFDLNTFFQAEGSNCDATFKYENYVQKWIDFIKGDYLESRIEDLKTGKMSPYPFSDVRLREALLHTLWFLPSVNACYAMKNLLSKKHNEKFFGEYEILVIAGNAVGQGAEAIRPIEKAMANPLETKTITLTCGKLTTGVTVKPWTGIFMLRNLKQPETYFQAAFRVQSPWATDNEIIKRECYVFDFSPNRTLRQLADYSCNLNVKEKNPEKK